MGDVRIYEYERIPVETTYDYESLVSMLLHGRFDLFPAGCGRLLRSWRSMVQGTRI